MENYNQLIKEFHDSDTQSHSLIHVTRDPLSLRPLPMNCLPTELIKKCSIWSKKDNLLTFPKKKINPLQEADFQ